MTDDTSISEDPSDPCQQPTFEQSLAELASIVSRLEEGKVSLAESLEQYERGVKLLRSCFMELDRVERRIELLSRVDELGRPIVTPYEEPEMDAAEKVQARSKRRTAGNGGGRKRAADDLEGTAEGSL